MSQSCPDGGPRYPVVEEPPGEVPGNFSHGEKSPAGAGQLERLNNHNTNKDITKVAFRLLMLYTSISYLIIFNNIG